MAAPNSLFIPTVARPHAQAIFLEIMDFLSADFGLIDFIPDSSQGGDYVHLPRHGKLSGGFARVDITGTLTTTQTAKTMTHKDEIAVVRHKSLLMEHFGANIERAGMTSEQFSAEVGRQIGIEAAKTLIVDCYRALIASADSVSTSHQHDVYVNDTDASDQVDFTPPGLATAKGLMGDLQQQMDIGAMVGKQFTDVTLGSISTTYNVPNIMGDVYQNGQFRELLGTHWIIDDQVPTTAGATTLSPTKYNALIMRSRKMHPNRLAPLVVSFQKALQIYEQHVLGLQSIKFQQQPELAYAIGVRGKTWDVGNGGANPTDANFIDKTNWDDAYSSHKEVGVILYNTNAS